MVALDSEMSGNRRMWKRILLLLSDMSVAAVVGGWVKYRMRASVNWLQKM